MVHVISKRLALTPHHIDMISDTTVAHIHYFLFYAEKSCVDTLQNTLSFNSGLYNLFNTRV